MNLPNELWLLILTYVEGFERHDIAAMAHCAQFFNTTLRPRLFRTVTLRSVGSLKAFERLALDAQKSQRWRFFAKLLKRPAKQVQMADIPPPRLPVLHLVINLAITFDWTISGTNVNVATRKSRSTILAACPNVETLFLDRRCYMNDAVKLIQDQPNVTRIFLANDNIFVEPLILHRGNQLQHLTHLWLNNLRYICRVFRPNNTIVPETFPALTHIVAGLTSDEVLFEVTIANVVRELLRFGRLQRLLLLIPAQRNNSSLTLLLPTLATLRDRRIFSMTDDAPDTRIFTSIRRWNALTDGWNGGAIWTSGTPVYDIFDTPVSRG